MVSQFFAYFLEQFDFWLWVLFWIAIFLTLTLSKGIKRVYFFVLIIGFLAIIKFIPHFYVAMPLIFIWLLLMNLEFFVSKWVLIFATLSLLFFDLSSPFFYLIVFALWTIMVWNFLSGSFAMLDSKPETS